VGLAGLWWEQENQRRPSRSFCVRQAGASRDLFRENYFQKGLLRPAGRSALSVCVSVHDSSEIFSSMKRDAGGAVNSSFLPGDGLKG
jgi:hypothetical protein